MERKLFHKTVWRGKPPTEHEVSDARFKRFLKDYESYERRWDFDTTLDATLALYSEWKRTKDMFLKVRIVFLLFECRRLNGDFRMEVIFDA